MEKVQKRDGRVIPFNREKITKAIFLAAKVVAEKEGKVPDYQLADEISYMVEGELNKKFTGTVPTVEQIQDVVVRTLISLGHARTAECYILYRGQRTKNREAKTRLMKQIDEITFSDAKESDVKRENANIDGNTSMGTMLQYGSAVSKEFCRNNLMKEEHVKAHENGDIHCHDMDFFAMGTLTCCQIDLTQLFKGGFSTGHGFLREPKSITSYGALAAIAIQSNQNDQHGGQSIPKFDYDLAHGVKKSFVSSYCNNLKKGMKLLTTSVDERSEEELVQILGGKDRIVLGNETYRKERMEKLQTSFNLSQEISRKVETFAYEEGEREVDRLTYKAMVALVHNLNTMHSRAGAQVPFSSLNFGTDTSKEGRMVTKNLLLAQEAGLGNGETPIFPILIFKVKDGINFKEGDPNYDLFQLAIRVSSKRLFPNFSFIDAPYNLEAYDAENANSEVAYMGCRTRVLKNHCGPDEVTGRGNISFTSINLPRLGIEYGIVQGRKKADLKGFFRALDEKMTLVIEQLLERLELQGKKQAKNFPFLMGQNLWRGSENLKGEDALASVIVQGTLTMGFIGLAECLVALTGHHHGEDLYARELGEQIIRFMRDRLDRESALNHLNFSLIATPAEGLSGRFTKIDKEKYGEVAGITDKEFYTNSFHVPVDYSIKAYEKLKIEAPYHAMTNGGHISYVEVDGSIRENPEAFEDIVRAMKELGIGYGSINHPVDRDPVCGYNGIIGDTCPSCGRNEGNVPFERIRRITGYLVGTLDRFNDAKREEVENRVKHYKGLEENGDQD